jgi:hypothetical protein
MQSGAGVHNVTEMSFTLETVNLIRDSGLDHHLKILAHIHVRIRRKVVLLLLMFLHVYRVSQNESKTGQVN